jgi:hypothetical protein
LRRRGLPVGEGRRASLEDFVRQEPEKVRDLWRFSDESFWRSPDDTFLRLIAVTPAAAELRDGSGTLVSGAKIQAERLVGAKVALVENAKVDWI